MAPAGTIPPEPSGARPKRPRGFSRGPERETSEPEAGVAARLMRRDGRSSSAGFLRVLGPSACPSNGRRINRQRLTGARPPPWGGLANSRLLYPPKEERSPFFPIQRFNQGPVFLLRPEMAGSLLPVAGSVFDERRKALGFSVAVGSSAVTVAFARSEGPGLVLLTVHSLDENVERTAARCGARIAGTN
jgi:hypothetical protein